MISRIIIGRRNRTRKILLDIDVVELRAQADASMPASNNNINSINQSIYSFKEQDKKAHGALTIAQNTLKKTY